MQVTVEETQRLIDTYFNTYRQTTAFLQDCQRRVLDPGWLKTAFGRCRRFIRSSDDKVIGEQQRQAQNFPIQGTVADAVSRAIDHLYYYRFDHDVDYRMLLQIHDAILFEVPIAHLREFVHGADGRPSVIQECMVNRVPVWPTRLDGSRREDVTEPYHFGIDAEVMLNWGAAITPEQAEAQNIPLDLL